MLPAAPMPVSGTQSSQSLTAQKAAQPQSPDTSRASIGESAAAKVRLETADAVKAPEQARIAARLRDEETAEQAERTKLDQMAGPPPAFEESPLERQARVALEPQEPQVDAETAELDRDETQIPRDPERPRQALETDPNDPSPTATQRAEASFAETKTLQTPAEALTVNVAR